MEHEKIHVSYIPIVRALMALATICKADLAVASIMPHAMPACQDCQSAHACNCGRSSNGCRSSTVSLDHRKCYRFSEKGVSHGVARGKLLRFSENAITPVRSPRCGR